MRIKSIMTSFIALPSLSLLCLLSSCSSEELTEKPSTGPQTVTLNLQAAGTRAAVYTDPGTSVENTINSVTIGIFSKNAGNAVKTIQEVPGSLSPKITTSQLVDGDIVLVAVNAESGTFTGVKNITDFENRTLTIDQALAGGVGSATTVANNKLPMFGTSTIALSDAATNSYAASVPVYHMVAKITLKSLSVDFSTTGAYKDAKFTPTEVFMSNVPNALDFYPATAYTTYATLTPFSQGETGVANLKAYLGTTTDFTGFTIKNATLSGQKTGTTYNWGDVAQNILYFYTMPNNASTPTRLVIKGNFDPGTGSSTTVYYPVNINYNSADGSAAEGGTAKVVSPNKNYTIDVTIQGKGSTDPTVAIDPQSATATITVQNFTSANQTNQFN